ncbi:MAG: CBS domain-containing protein [Dehalococcoidales bacterium]|nr:CBS domain-containing protein [Dehalococcoidales bacterium]
MGIRIRVHYTWILVFALVTAIISTQFSENYPLWQRITLGLVVSLLFLLAATIREIILNTAAFGKEISIKKITVFAFGGVYQENKNKIESTHLPLLYLARFFSNLVIAVIFYGLYATFINTSNFMMAGVTQWLAYIYIVLFLLHLVPAFPLDGGQILRLIIWRSTGDYYKATKIASLIGWAIGLFLIFTAVLVFIITKLWMISLLIVIIGWVIQDAAGNTRQRINTLMTLRGIRARDIMTTEYLAMPRQMNIGQLVREYILIKGWRYVVVVSDTQLQGILTVQRIKSIPRKRWALTTIDDIMTPSDNSITAYPQQTVDVLLEAMDQRRLDYLPVLDENKLIGVVSRETLISLVKTRAGFGF